MKSALLSLLLTFTLLAQNPGQRLVAPEQPNPKTLIPQATIESMVSEVSGSVAFQHIVELAGYEHDRLAEEYKTTYREAAYIEKMAKQYGLEDVHIERFKLPNKTWDGELGEVWMLAPQKKLVISYRDIAATLATGSKTGDVTADLVYVGRGERESDYQGKDVAGKLVLASGATGTVHNMAVRRFNAAGVLSFNNPVGRPIDRPDQIAWNGLGGRGGFGGGGAAGAEPPKTTFGFNLSHRIGMELLELLERGEKVTLRAKVKATEYDAEMQIPTAVIKGDGSSQQEIAITGHLFEGIAKQGAMDDSSGCAVVLEAARAWKKLIDDGVLPRPRRTVRLLWVPEISGTNAYLRRFPEETKRMVAAIAIDMAGEDTKLNKNSLRLMRMPYSVNGFVNEVTQQFFEYVGDTNREKVQNRRIAYSYMFPIVDPQGSRDQFYYNIEKHYGSSDHTVFIGQGVPAVLFNNWPDWSYHTSEDRPANADPTQLKRAVFITLASAHVMANADGAGALRISEVSAGNAAERLGRELGLALQMIGEGGSYKDAVAFIRAAYSREDQAIRSAAVLAEADSKSAAAINQLAGAFVDAGLRADVERLGAYAKARGASTSITLTSDEEMASKLIPKRKGRAPAADPAADAAGGGGRGAGGPGGGGGGGGRGAGGPLPGQAAAEARAFADGKRSVLDICAAVEAEFGSQGGVTKFVEFFKAQEKSGEFELAARP